MRFFLTCPTLAPHGGIRVILEWANRLAQRGHQVVLRVTDPRGCGWFALDERVYIAEDDGALRSSQCLIVCSPHGADYLTRPDAPARRFAFMQMAEHLFRPRDKAWQRQCQKFYRTPHPLILLSRWNETMLRGAGRAGPVHYVGNGVNLDDFPIDARAKDGRAVLVEGWTPENPTKDWDRIGPQVAARLGRMGWEVLAYGRHEPKHDDPYRAVPTEFVARPSRARLSELYQRATILIKASHCDARACAPMEAMTKGTVTVRAIDQGDDDLVHNVNCLRTPYDVEALFAAAKLLLVNDQLRERLAAACLEYVTEHSWDGVMDQVEQILVPAAARALEALSA